MKSIYFLPIILFSSCAAKMQYNMTGIDRFKYPGDPKIEIVERIFDNLSGAKMSKIVLNYYLTLDSKSFKSLELRLDTTSNLGFFPAKAIFVSKRAKKGYLKINKYINDSVNTEVSIDYLINSDTVNNEKMIDKLILLKNRDVVSCKLLDESHINIVTPADYRGQKATH